MNGKLLKSIKSISVNILAYVRVKGGESEYFRTDNSVRQESIMSPCVFNVYMDAMMIYVKLGIGRRGVRFQEEGRE